MRSLLSVLLHARLLVHGSAAALEQALVGPPFVGVRKHSLISATADQGDMLEHDRGTTRDISIAMRKRG